MNVLVLNGSPRGEGSNTLKITTAFVKGLESARACLVETVNVSKSAIGHCLGCFTCWTKTPGACVIKDDMGAVLEKYLKADVVLWSFPLYYFGMPSKIKALNDRMLPLLRPEIRPAGDGAHPHRYDMPDKKTVLISTCGFYGVEKNYRALRAQFDTEYGENNYTAILCPEGELLRVPALSGRTGEYLEIAEQAGAEFGRDAAIFPETAARLAEPFYPPAAFMEMANASWDIAGGEEPAAAETGKKENPRARFLRQMAASCRSSALKKPVVVEMYFTDVDETWQLHLSPESCTCEAGTPFPYTTRIETPSQVWYDISEGKITGEEALFQHKFRVVGDFSLMLRFNDYFATARREPKKYEKTPQKRSMLFMLVPWIAFWVTSPMRFSFALYIPIIVSALIPLFSRRWKLTLYDTLSVFLVSALSVLAMAGLHKPLVASLSYGLFGLLWLGSLATPIPLCAWYSSAGYGGDSAFGNPLFLRTNRIIAAAWGGLYILTAVWTYFIMGSFLRPYIGLINHICPVLLGIFTLWFVGWHPPHYARGEIRMAG